MRVSLTDAGKRYNRDWIFRHLNFNFDKGISYAITGPNGSGKSTLLQAISGAIGLNEGKMSYETGGDQTGNGILTENAFQYISICAPYLEVVEEMTFREFMSFHQSFKPFIKGTGIDQMMAAVQLENAADKQIRFYSSGMKQRVKLAQALFSDTPILLLDEPCTNLDTAGISLYHQLINDYCKERLVIVSSNDPEEYGFCHQQLKIQDWK
ncbi:MAG: ATP-binding cassette domain-containing protein [Terrimonas sp.]|nr:ATP-binding cassette domain-containing protein [Terrimonas sp.]